MSKNLKLLVLLYARIDTALRKRAIITLIACRKI
jgi:hypothetical protein